MDGWTDGRTDGRTDGFFLVIDFVCPHIYMLYHIFRNISFYYVYFSKLLASTLSLRLPRLDSMPEVKTEAGFWMSPSSRLIKMKANNCPSRLPKDRDIKPKVSEREREKQTETESVCVCVCVCGLWVTVLYIYIILCIEEAQVCGQPA